MKVCIIGLRGFPGVVGGVETHCEQLYPRLKSIRPLDEFIIIGRKPYINQSEFAYQGVRIIPLFAVRNKYLEAISNALIAVFHARFKLRADVLHIHAIGPSLVAPLAKLLGMKVVITHHGDDYNRAKWNSIARFVLRVGEYLGVKFSDQMISISASVANRLKGRFPDRTSKVEHIPNGANHAVGHASIQAQPDQGELLQQYGLANRRYIVCVGRLVPEKCFEDAIIAFNEAAGFDRLVIVGGAEKGSTYLRKLQELAGSRVMFTGALPRQEVDILLANASLFILPSSHEGLPIVALEAIATDIPVLLSDINPNLDIGLPSENYFALHDTAQLASKMNSDLSRYRVEKNVFRQYDWNSISRRTHLIYERLASVQGAPIGAAIDDRCTT